MWVQAYGLTAFAFCEGERRQVAGEPGTEQTRTAVGPDGPVGSVELEDHVVEQERHGAVGSPAEPTDDCVKVARLDSEPGQRNPYRAQSLVRKTSLRRGGHTESGWGPAGSSHRITLPKAL